MSIIAKTLVSLFIYLVISFPARASDTRNEIDLSVSSVTAYSINKEQGNLTDILATVVLSWKGRALTDYKINGHRNNVEGRFYIDEFCPENNKDRCFSAKYLSGFKNFVAELNITQIEHLSAKCFSLIYAYDDILAKIKRETESKASIIYEFYVSRKKSYANLGKRCLLQLEKLGVTNAILVAHYKAKAEYKKQKALSKSEQKKETDLDKEKAELARQKAELEKQKVEFEEKERRKNEDAEIRAKQEKAEIKRQKSELAKQKAELEKQKAEFEKQKALLEKKTSDAKKQKPEVLKETDQKVKKELHDQVSQNKDKIREQLQVLAKEEIDEVLNYLNAKDMNRGKEYENELARKRNIREKEREVIFSKMKSELKSIELGNLSDKQKINELKRIASYSGNAYAEYELAKIYMLSSQSDSDKFKAFFWMQKAASAGVRDAREALALFYAEGHFVEKDEKGAIYWWVKAISQKSKKALDDMIINSNNSDTISFNLGRLFLDGRYLDINAYEAQKLFSKLKNKIRGADIKELEARVLLNDYDAFLELGMLLQDGERVEKDIERATFLLFEASENSSSKYKKRLAKKQYLIAREEFLQVSAENGDDESQYQLGNLKLSEKKLNEALRWFQKLSAKNYKDTKLKILEINAEKGDLHAQYEMAKKLEKGEEVERDIDKALKYFEKLAAKNYKNSLFLKTKLLAEKKDKKALFVFGKYLEEGKEIKKNNREALKYYNASADKNYLDAKIKLAQIYRLGLLGTEKDFDLSLDYFRSAVNENGYSLNKVYGYIEKFAEAGRKDAALWLGDMHYYAKIKSASEKTALAFYKQAQDNGSKEAEYKIEELSKCLNESKGFFSSIFSRSDNSLGECILNGHYAIVNSHIDVEEEKKIVACSNFTRAFSNDPRTLDKNTNEPGKKQKEFNIKRLFKNSIDHRAYNLKGQSFTGMKGFPIVFTEEPSGASLSNDERTGEQFLVIATEGYVQTFLFRNKTKLIPTSHSCDRGKACTKDFKNLMGSFINVSKNLQQLCRLDQWPDGKQLYESAPSPVKKKVNFGSSTSDSNSYKANSPYRAEIKCLDVSGFETRLDLCFSDRLSFMKIKIGPTERTFDQTDMLQGGLRQYNFGQFDQVLKIDLPNNNWLVAVRNYSKFYNVIIEVKNRYGDITYSGNSKNGMLAGTRLN